MDESLCMQCDEDCRTAGFGKTERPVGWEGNGEPITMGLVRHCEGKPAATDRLHLPSLSHSFTLDFLLCFQYKEDAERVMEVLTGQRDRLGRRRRRTSSADDRAERYLHALLQA